MKKIIALLLCAVLFVGCGGTSEPPAMAKYAEAAIKVLEQYDTAEISAAEAKEKLGQLQNNVSAYEDDADKEIANDALGISIAIRKASSGITRGDLKVNEEISTLKRYTK